MPSARAEVRVVRQEAPPQPCAPPCYFTGGDSWPAIDLAQVTFDPTPGGILPPLVLGQQGRDAMSLTGALMGQTELRPRGAMSLVKIDAARAAAGGPVTGSANPGHLHQAPSIAIDPDLKLGHAQQPGLRPAQAWPPPPHLLRQPHPRPGRFRPGLCRSR